MDEDDVGRRQWVWYVCSYDSCQTAITLFPISLKSSTCYLNSRGQIQPSDIIVSFWLLSFLLKRLEMPTLFIYNNIWPEISLHIL